NKIDLVDFDQAVFDRIVADYRAFAADLNFLEITPIPMSARHGDNVTLRSAKTPWYKGLTLIEHLETVDVASDTAEKPFRFPVQWVNRPNLDFRGFSGAVASVTVAASGRQTKVARIVTYDGDLDEAKAGDAVTLTLTDEVDIARGDLLSAPTARPEVADQFAAHVLWMGDEPLLPGRPY